MTLRALTTRPLIVLAMLGLAACSTPPEPKITLPDDMEYSAVPTEEMMMEAAPEMDCAPGEGDGIGGTGCEAE